MRRILPFILVGLAVAWVAIATSRGMEARARLNQLQSEIETFRDSIETLRMERDSMKVDRDRVDLERARVTSELSDSIRAVSDSLEASEAVRADSRVLIDSLLTSQPETIQVFVRQLESDLLRCRMSLSLNNHRNDLCNSRLAARDSTISDLALSLTEADSLYHAQLVLTDGWKRQASWSAFKIRMPSFPEMALLGGLVFLLLTK